MTKSIRKRTQKYIGHFFAEVFQSLEVYSLHIIQTLITLLMPIRNLKDCSLNLLLTTNETMQVI